MVTERENLLSHTMKLSTSIKAIVVLSTLVIFVTVINPIIAVLIGMDVSWAELIVLSTHLSFYILAIVLSLKHMKWGYAIGIAIAFFSVAISVSNNSWYTGTREIIRTIALGQLTNPSVFAPIAGILNLALLFFCARAFREHPSERGTDVVILVASLVIVLVCHSGLYLLL
jgi:hypothetical protein